MWFKPFWENLCSLRDSQAEELANTRRDIANVRLVVDRLSEGQQRVKGVEEGLGGTETRVDELAQESKVQINQLLEVSRRLNEHESQLNQMKIDLLRAFNGRNASQSTGAPPMRARSVGVDDANVQEGVTAAQNQPTSYWPGSQPPPSTLPPLGTVMDGANTVGQPAAAHEETKPVVGNRWSSSVPSPQMRLGPLVPHLAPLNTILQPFQTVMDYRHYRLVNMAGVPTDEDLKHLYKVKERAQSRYRSLEVFDGSDPMKLFEFLATYKRAMDDMGKSEAVAVRALDGFLEEDSLDAYKMQMTSDISFVDGQDTTTWPHVVNCLLSTFITDELLQSAYNEVVQARQRPKEHISAFILRLQDLAKKCHGVFAQAEMANMVLLGMKTSIRLRIQHAVNNLTPLEKISLPKIRQLAVQEDNAQREQANELSQSSASGPRGGRKADPKANKTMHIGGPSDVALPSPPTTPAASQASAPITEASVNGAHDPAQMVDYAAGLSYLFAVTEQEQGVRKAIERNKLDPTSIMQTMQSLPGLSDDQLDQAMSVIPSDYWRLSCWTCRQHGHVTYVCPFLDPKQRVFFAYCYYMHQVQNNPQLKKWYQRRLDFFQGRGPSPGPRPGSDYASGGTRGRGGGRGGGQGMRPRPQGPPPTLPAPAPVAGALPAPAAAEATSAAAPIAVVQEESSASSSENE